MTPLELHAKALALIIDPTHWTQGAMARRSDGTTTDINAVDACKFCSMGALVRGWVKLLPHSNAPYFVVHDALKNAVGIMPSEYNDHHTHAQVMAMWRRAGNLLKEQTT